MKTFEEIRKEIINLSEGKISMATLKKGDKVQMRFKGRGAKNQGFKNGDNPYGEGNKIQILGFGTVKRGAKATAKNAIFNSVADFKTKWKEELKANIRNHPSQEEAEDWERDLSGYTAAEKLDKNINHIIDQSNGKGTSTGKKLKAASGWTCYIYKVLDGENKGDISYVHVSDDGSWTKYWDTDTEFWLESRNQANRNLTEGVLNKNTIKNKAGWDKLMKELLKLGKSAGFKMTVPPGSDSTQRKPSLEKEPFFSPNYASAIEGIYYTVSDWEDGMMDDDGPMPKKMSKIKANKQGSYDIINHGDDSITDLMAEIYIALKDFEKAGADINAEKEYKRLVG